MEYDIRVVRVDRPNGEAKKVIIDVLSFRIGLVKKDGLIRETERIRLDGKTIRGPEDLFVPPAPYGEMMRVARGIFFDPSSHKAMEGEEKERR